MFEGLELSLVSSGGARTWAEVVEGAARKSLVGLVKVNWLESGVERVAKLATRLLNLVLSRLTKCL